MEDIYFGRIKDDPKNSTNAAEFDESIHQISLATNIVMLLLIVPTNVLIIVTVVLVRRLHTPDNIIIAGLAIADLLVGVNNVPGYIVQDVPNTRYFFRDPEWICRFKYISRITFQESSLSFLMVMCVDRALAVSFPFKHDEFATNSSAVAVLVVFFLLELTRSLVMYGFLLTFDENDAIEKRCKHNNTPQWYYGVFMSAKQYAEICISAIACTVVVVAVRRQKKKIRRNSLNSSKNSQAMKTNILLTFLFVILWTPSYLIPVVTPYLSPKQGKLYKLTCRQLKVANSFVNGIVYSILKKSYKEAFIYLLTTLPWCWNRYEISRRGSMVNRRCDTITNDQLGSSKNDRNKLAKSVTFKISEEATKYKDISGEKDKQTTSGSSKKQNNNNNGNRNNDNNGKPPPHVQPDDVTMRDADIATAMSGSPPDHNALPQSASTPNSTEMQRINTELQRIASTDVSY